MKIALQLSGRLRYTDKSLESLINCIVEPLNPDIFFSFWEPFNTETKTVYQKILNPKCVMYENHSLIAPYFDHIFQFDIHKNMPYMCYKFYQISKLRQGYEVVNNIKYDLVIQARSDNLFFEMLDLTRCQQSIEQDSILCCNQLYTPTIDDYIPQPRMVDNFYLGPSKLVDKASETIWHLKEQIHSYIDQKMYHHIRIPEIIQSKIWQDKNIKIGSLNGTGSVNNFWYDIDRSETKWK